MYLYIINIKYIIKYLLIIFHSIVLDSVSSEDWYKKIESFIDSADMLSKAQGPSAVRPFITFVQDAHSKELKQLSFDKSMFARERRADVSFLNYKLHVDPITIKEDYFMMYMHGAFCKALLSKNYINCSFA